MSKGLKINDKVQVIAGAHKGETAKIIKMDRENNKAILEGINSRERHMRATQFNPRGGKKTIQLGIDLSNLKLVEAAKYEKTAKKAEKAPKTKKGDK